MSPREIIIGNSIKRQGEPRPPSITGSLEMLSSPSPLPAIHINVCNIFHAAGRVVAVVCVSPDLDVFMKKIFIHKICKSLKITLQNKGSFSLSPSRSLSLSLLRKKMQLNLFFLIKHVNPKKLMQLPSEWLYFPALQPFLSSPPQPKCNICWLRGQRMQTEKLTLLVDIFLS